MLANLAGKLREIMHATVWALGGVMVGDIFHMSLKVIIGVTIATAIFGCFGTS